MRRSSLLRNANRVFIIGGAITPFIGKGNKNFIDKNHPDFGKKTNPTLQQLLQQTVKSTLDNCQLTGKEEVIDHVVVANFIGEICSSQGHLGAGAVGALNYGLAPGAKNPLNFKPAYRVEAACGSGGIGLMTAVDSLKAGSADVALMVGVEVETATSTRLCGDALARAADYDRQRPDDDFTFPCLIAKRMKYCVEHNHFTMEDAARVAVKAYANANLNPLAHMHSKKLTLEEANIAGPKNPFFLSNQTYKNFIRVTDCSQVTDGGAGLVVVNEAGLKKLGMSVNDTRLVEVNSIACAASNLWEDPVDGTRMPTSERSAQKALALAGVKASDLQVAELHDGFTPVELLMYEALGLAEYGKGKDLIRSGATNLDGRIPVNTGGGLLAFGHPAATTGVKQFMEVYRQMKGLCGAYQMKKIPGLGVAMNMGGDDKTVVTTIMSNI